VVVVVITEVTDRGLFDVTAEALVNPVNTQGAMGAGLALTFRKQYPKMFEEYRQVCERRMLDIGVLHWWQTGEPAPRFVVNFPTKRQWREPSRLSWIDTGLVTLRQQVEDRQIMSVAIPALGCGLGGLSWDGVRAKILEHFRFLYIDVFVFPPR
jgi:O-acetyl-ADP-ribose deacetylase (regulator of RNase III)